MTIRRAGRRAILFFELGLVLAAALVASACSMTTVRGSFHRAPRVDGPLRLHVSTGSGDIAVRTGRPGQVSIVGRIAASWGMFDKAKEEVVREIAAKPPIRRTGDAIRVERPPYDNVSIDYEIVVPADTELHADTGSGDCQVRGLRADVAVETGSGDVRLHDIVGDVRAVTGSGNIDGRRVAGSVDAHTGSGDIAVFLAGAGNVGARTGSGNAEVRGVHGALVVHTGSGDVIAEGLPSSPWQVGTSSGDVSVLLPKSASFDLEATTSSGDINLGRPVHTIRHGRIDDDDKHVGGRVGGGGPLVAVRTGSGDITVR